ncbi:hypothetical protein DFH27DRAFT_565616 [Peziza echinospora]|nr:hypothetical protein DFH27DRAFT_565616 [Peziza echinospora]
MLDEQSYSEIRERDVGAIGKHCDIPSCHMLDFLPFKCESCNGTYCLDHRTETAHKCAHEGKWAAERLRRELGVSKTPRQSGGGGSSSSSSTSTGHTLASTAPPTTCPHQKCKTTINTPRSAGVFCPACKRTYCLAHRLQDAHDCSSLPPLPGTPAAAASLQTQAAAEKARAAFARFKAWTSTKTEKVKEKRQGSAAVELLRLKRVAKGDAKIPAEKRVYVYVEAEKGSTSSRLPKGEFYFNREWSVGKVLDVAAGELGVTNVNNRGEGEEERLRVFHVEGGRMLSFGEKVGDAVGSGNTIVLLRGVMAAELIEV